MLSLMRSAKLISYGFIGGYEPGVGSDTGLGLGKTFKLNYAVIPHAGDWRSAHPWRAGLEFNNPLIVRTLAGHPGDLPAKWGLVELPAAGVVVSALKPSKGGGAVLRVYEPAGQPSPGIHANWNINIGEVHEVNLIEDPVRRVPAQQRSFEFDLKPYEIKSFSVQLKSQTAERASSTQH
jgi:alpha-mannosidase